MFGRKKNNLNDEWGALEEEPKIKKNAHPTRHLRLEDIDPKKAEEERKKQEELKKQEEQIREIKIQKELAPKKPEPLSDPDTNVLFQLDHLRKEEADQMEDSSKRKSKRKIAKRPKKEKDLQTSKKTEQLPKAQLSKAQSPKAQSSKQMSKLTKGQQMAMNQLEDVEDHGIDPGRMIELPEWDLPDWAKKVGIIAIVLFVVIGMGVLGYAESDFNTSGEPKIVSYETRRERMYVKQSDRLLQEMIDDAAYIQDHTADMSNYIDISTKLQQQKNKLNTDTTKLSKYVDVPDSMEAYHTKLINVSLGIQKLQTDIINNYQASDYADWRASNVSSMNDSMETLHKMRFQIDERIWEDAQ